MSEAGSEEITVASLPRDGKKRGAKLSAHKDKINLWRVVYKQ